MLSAFRQCSSNANGISLDRKKTNSVQTGLAKTFRYGKTLTNILADQIYRLLYQNLTGIANLKTTMDTHTHKEKATKTLKDGYQIPRKRKRKGRQ